MLIKVFNAWRGADIQNILDFEKDYPNCTSIKLEQNYRSTKIILDAANAVIDNNEGRPEKNLWTDKIEGAKIQHFTAQSEHEEAAFIGDTIAKKHDIHDVPYGDMPFYIVQMPSLVSLKKHLLSEPYPIRW